MQFEKKKCPEVPMQRSNFQKEFKLSGVLLHED